MFANALDPEITTNPPAAEVLRAEAEALEKAVPGDQSVMRTLDAYNKLTPHNPDDWPNQDDISEVLNYRPSFAAWALALLACIPVAVGLAYLRSKYEVVDQVAPHLVWLLTIPLGPADIDKTSSPFAWFVLLAIPALFKPTRTGALIIGSIVAGAWLAFVSQTLQFAAPGILFVVSAWSRRFRLGSHPATAAAVIMIGCAFAAATWTVIAFKQGPVSAITYTLLGLLGAGMAVPRLEEKRLLSAAAAAVIVGGLVYAGMAFQCMSWNVRAGAAADAMLNEADRMRERSGAF
jgi:hypothetical protein